MGELKDSNRNAIFFIDKLKKIVTFVKIIWSFIMPDGLEKKYMNAIVAYCGEYLKFSQKTYISCNVLTFSLLFGG